MVCITVKDSPNLSHVYIRICKHRKKVFYCFYKTTFPRKKAKLSCLEHWLKEKFLPVAKSCTQSLYVQSVFVLQKRCFPKYGFFSLKMSAQAKKNWHSMLLKIFQVSTDKEWVNYCMPCLELSSRNNWFHDFLFRNKVDPFWITRHVCYSFKWVTLQAKLTQLQRVCVKQKLNIVHKINYIKCFEQL